MFNELFGTNNLWGKKKKEGYNESFLKWFVVESVVFELCAILIFWIDIILGEVGKYLKFI